MKKRNKHGKEHFCFPVTAVAVYNKLKKFTIVFGNQIFWDKCRLRQGDSYYTDKKGVKINSKTHEFGYKFQINFAGNNNFGRFNSKTCYTRIFLNKISITTPAGAYKKNCYQSIFHFNQELTYKLV